MDVGKAVMYIIAGTLAVSTAIVLLAKGIDAMPFHWYGLVGAIIFFIAAIVMTRIAPDATKH